MVTSSFLEVLARETTILQAQHPALADALSRACAILTERRLFVEESGREATVLASDGAGSYHVNGHCTCPASTYHEAPCKHRLALRLYQRVADAMQAEEERWVPDDDNPAFQPPHGAPTIPPEHMTTIQGRPFVRFEGLLALAHQHGLTALATTVVSVSAELAVCQCVATFADGRVFTDIGDATPTNIARHLAPHFIRMSATRASARALRRALNISACSVEELDGSEVSA